MKKLCGLVALLVLGFRQEKADPEGLAFFEKKIRLRSLQQGSQRGVGVWAEVEHLDDSAEEQRGLAARMPESGDRAATAQRTRELARGEPLAPVGPVELP